jgi:HEAT repeat protein
MTGPLADRLHEPRDRRSTGRADAVAAAVLAEPERFLELVTAMLGDDRLVRMRAADAAEKVTRARPDLLAPHAQTLLDRVAALPEPEVRWHVAQLLPRLPLPAVEREPAIGVLRGYLDDTSRIVQTCALQALVDLTEGDARTRASVLALVRRWARDGSPAVRARARRLLAEQDVSPRGPVGADPG